ncbi:hypothetical protein M0R45_000879 [Rubus argutus]|uniref:Uncharacterized protein n=1 Tax=Rubus argutus TaxID=59490 RepID=A0AAW1VPH4_RUBAR
MDLNTLLQILWIPSLLLPLLLLLLKKLNKPQKHFPPSPPKLVLDAALALTGLFADHYDIFVGQNLFLVGIDTGAIAMVWAMAELATKPRVMKKAQEEVRNCIGNKRKSH